MGNGGKVGCKDMSSIQLAQDKNPVSGVMTVILVLNKGKEYFDQMSNYQPFKEDVGSFV